MKLVRLIALFLFMIPVLSLSLNGQTREELEKKRKEIQQEIEELQRAQRAISKDKKASLGQLNLVQSKLQKRNAVIENIKK
jgi:3-hydroxyacyl-CoA dehydrogenase